MSVGAGNYSFGGVGYAEHRKKSNTMNTGIPGGGQPRQRNVVAQAQSDRTVGFTLRNFGAEEANLELVVKGGTHAITGEAVATGTITSITKQTVYRNIVPGTFTITGGATENFTDNGDGTLDGSTTGSGVIDYVTGVYTLTYGTNSGAGSIVAAYTHSDWAPFSTPQTKVMSAGAGEQVWTLQPDLGSNASVSEKNNELVGIAAWAVNAGTAIQVEAIHAGDDTSYRLEDPRELLRGPIEDRSGPTTIQ